MRTFVFLSSLLLAACSTGSVATIAPAARAEAITCTAAYRADVSQPIAGEESVVFTDNDAAHSIAFADLTFHAAYRAGETDNERTLRIRVSDAADAITYQSLLYQLDPESGPLNQFWGGHGFTGLGYGYHPVSQAEIQFWCQAGA